MLTKRVSEVRTQIYLPKAWHEKVQKIARRQGVSMAMVIRKTLKDGLALSDVDEEKKREMAWKALMKLAGIAKDKIGATDVSQHPGEYWAQAIEEKLKRRSK